MTRQPHAALNDGDGHIGGLEPAPALPGNSDGAGNNTKTT
jgi:hypothetical protein